MKRFVTLLLALVMILSLATTAFAQTVDSGKGGSASITIENASKGETYKVIKLFDASVTGDEDGSIVYTGQIPTDLSAYFETVNGYIQFKEGADEAAAFAAMKTWADSQTATASATSDGTTLTFTGLQYGYYAVLSSQGAVVTIDSTNPNAIVYDKNTKEPTISKEADDSDVDIGQTVTYTVKATTANYLGDGADAEIVTQYVITDTLPDFLTDVKVTSITIGGADYKVNGAVPQFDSNDQIIIPWAVKDDEGHYASLYANGAEIVITYTAKVTNQAEVDGTTGNVNTVTMKPWTTPDDNTPDDPWEEEWEDDAVIYTYAAALKKVDENGNSLAGAKFAVKGLIVEGTAGNYTVVSYNPNSEEQGTVMETDVNGNLVIKGLNSAASLTVYETEAPAGYNKLTAPITVTVQKIGEVVTVTSTKVYYDENGNVTQTETENYSYSVEYNKKLEAAAVKVENKKGTELPSTGGMGTTLFYVFGAILMVGAAVLLVTKRRMSMAE